MIISGSLAECKNTAKEPDIKKSSFSNCTITSTPDEVEDISIYTLYSGSGGNCIYVRYGNDAILIDCGSSARAVKRSLSLLGADISLVRGIFVTHEHQDHVAALDVLCRHHHLPIHITSESEEALYGKMFTMHDYTITHTPYYTETVGKMTIRSFPTPHDSVMSVGYTIEFEGKDIRFGIATDIGHISDEIISSLTGCTHVIIEANHDISMLKYGPYPAWLKRRILSPYGHLSNDDCGTLACTLVDGGARSILLAHLSEENNRPDIAVRTVSEALARASFDTSEISLAAANAHTPTRLI